MDEELVRDSSSGNDGDTDTTVSPFPYSDFMERECPYYLAMGMTYEEYWEGSAELTIFFREKAKIERQRKNYEMWLQGAYIYHALMAVAPAFNALAKDHTPSDYLDDVIPQTKQEAEKQKIRKERKRMEEQMNRFRASVMNVNRTLKKREEGGVE